MPKVIVLEGPDSSGKTYLANEIAMNAEGLGKVCTINHSPASKGMQWFPEWDTWTEDAGDRYDGQVIILDRTPELSEIIYGYSRGRPRLRSVTGSINSVNGSGAAVVFCLPNPYIPKGEHKDAAGTDLGDANMHDHYKWYEFLYWQMFWSPPLKSSVFKYNWKDPSSVENIHERMEEWLT